MKFPVWHRGGARPLTLRLTPAMLAVCAGSAALLAFSGMSIGYAVGARTSTPAKAMTARVVAQPQVALPAATADQQLKAMNERMAELQARMMQLDALGQHLVESANVRNSKEFDFSPANGPMGGPLLLPEQFQAGKPELEQRIKALASDLDRREAQLRALDTLLAVQRLQDKQFLGNLPVRHGEVTSTFGYRVDPFTGQAAFHSGIDFAGPTGTDIYAVAPGVVVHAGMENGYGNAVEIDHGNGYVTRYGHAERLLVKQGDRVAKDQLIAYMGTSGRSTGPHLHYEVLRDGKQIDPAGFVTAALRR